MAGGRPSSYKPEYAEQAKKLCELGATDANIADFFHVTITTIGTWKTQYPEFLTSLKAGKEPADDRVERSLYQRATGYTFDAVKIFPPKGDGAPVIVPYREHVPPDTTACIFWLKNRRHQQWRDVHKVEHGQVGEFDAVDNADDLRSRLVAQAKELGQGDIAAALSGSSGANGSKPH